MNMAMKIATWLPRVNDAGSITIRTGENMGIISPIAISKPDMASLTALRLFIESLLIFIWQSSFGV